MLNSKKSIVNMDQSNIIFNSHVVIVVNTRQRCWTISSKEILETIKLLTIIDH